MTTCDGVGGGRASVPSETVGVPFLDGYRIVIIGRG
jgi:hypothetical protein